MAFTTLHHHIDLDLLREAYRRTRKDGAVGVDGQTAENYAVTLEENLQSLLDRFKLRLGFVVYGGISRRDWRTISAEDVKADVNEVKMGLLPMLRSDRAPARESLPAWTDNLVAECRDLLSALLPLTDDEMEFLGRLNDAGEIAPELIAGDSVMQARIKNDRRDAATLARLHRAGELTAVWVPNTESEAMRDLTRSREDAKYAETRARQRLGALLLRHGRRYPCAFQKPRLRCRDCG